MFPCVDVYIGCYSHPELFDITFAFFGCVLGCFPFFLFFLLFFFSFEQMRAPALRMQTSTGMSSWKKQEPAPLPTPPSNTYVLRLHLTSIEHVPSSGFWGVPGQLKWDLTIWGWIWPSEDVTACMGTRCLCISWPSKWCLVTSVCLHCLPESQLRALCHLPWVQIGH